MIFKCKSCEEFQCSEQCHCEMVHGKPKGCIKGEHGGTMEWVPFSPEDPDTSWIKSGIWCYDHNELKYAYIAGVTDSMAELLYLNNSIEPKKCSIRYVADTCEPQEVEPYTFEQAPPFVKVQYMSGNCTQPTMLILLPNGYWDPDVDEETSFYKIAQICRTFDGKPVGVGFVEPKK